MIESRPSGNSIGSGTLQSDDHEHGAQNRCLLGYARTGLALFSYVMIILSITAFLAGLAANALSRTNPHFARNWEFPLSDPTDVLADERGRVYIALGFYGRIQVYDADGRFLHGFFVPADGGDFRLRLDENGMLNAVTARGNRIHAYDRRGVLLSTERYKEPDVLRPLRWSAALDLLMARGADMWSEMNFGARAFIGSGLMERVRSKSRRRPC